jgi:hypothetical protein
MNYILNTSENNNLFVKGPTNYFKHGAQALEAIIETDWIPYTFTLNWKITKPHEKVSFFKDEPLATIFPIPRGYIESFQAEEHVFDTEDPLYKEHIIWANKREELKKEPKQQHGYYTRGVVDSGSNKIFEKHQRSIVGCPFSQNKNIGDKNEQ